MKSIFRLVKIIHIFLKHDLSQWCYDIPYLKILKPIAWCYPRSRKSEGARLNEALTECGPIFIKFGQLLSTRYDLFSVEIVEELSKLQDRVKSFSGEQARLIVERELGSPIEDHFSYFSSEPLACASIAQVHEATLLSGEYVAVKVLRPLIEETLQPDLVLLNTLAKWLNHTSKMVRQFKPCEMVEEFEKIILRELDLKQEAASASLLKKNFEDSLVFEVPEVIWPLSTHKVLTTTRVIGIPIYQKNILQEHGICLEKLARNLIETFFTQAFRDGFFHGDLHPGNLFVSPMEKDNPKIIAVDFGIMGTLSTNDQNYLAENLLAFIQRDYRRVAEYHLESGWITDSVKLEAFEANLRTVCEPLFERPLKEISIGKLLVQLFQTAHTFEINIQPQLILLQKTLLYVEGLSRQLAPNIDLWQTAKPSLEKWMKTRLSIRGLIRKLKNLPWSNKLSELIPAIQQYLDQWTKPVPNKHPEPAHSGTVALGLIITVCLSIMGYLVARMWW